MQEKASHFSSLVVSLSAITLSLLTPAQAEPKNPAVLTAEPARVQASLSRLPLRFEKNVGQIDPSVQYLCRTSGYMLFLTQKEAVMTLRAPEESSSSHSSSQKAAQKTDSRSAVVRLRFQGGDSTAQIVGQEKQEGITNYLRGQDPSQWHTNVPSFRKVVYRKVYPGIDAIFYGNARKLEYDFVVAPGANPKCIRLAVEGTSRLRLDKRGDLLLETSAGTLVQKAPIVYQNINGKNEIVAAKYTLLGDTAPRGTSIGIRLGKYDRTRPLIIDPTLDYSTYLGGTSHDTGNAIAVDSSGNAYITGASVTFFGTPDYPTTTGAYQTTAASNSDLFVTKLNSSGTGVVYSTYIGGNGGDTGHCIAVDSSGNAYIGGQATISSTFPTTVGAYNTSITDGGFVAKLNSTGTALSYSTGIPFDWVRSIAVDTSGNAYLVGGGIDTEVIKLDSSGSSLTYSVSITGGYPRVITLDSSNNAYVAGVALNTFTATTGAYQTSYPGTNAIFMAKLNSSGSAWDYKTFVGIATVNGIAVDSSGNAYITGDTYSSSYPTTSSAYQTTMAGGNDVFVTKLNSSGTALVYSTFVGGSTFTSPANASIDQGYGIVLDSSDNAYVAGYTTSSNFPTTSGAYQSSGTYVNAFLFKLSSNGTALSYSTYFGGSGGDHARAIAIDSSGGVYITGITDTSVPVTTGAYQTTFGGWADAFVAKFSGL